MRECYGLRPSIVSERPMRAVFLDYATVSFNGDLDPSALRRAMPGLELRDNTPQAAVPEAIAGATVVALNKLRISRETITAVTRPRAHRARGHRHRTTSTSKLPSERGIGVCNLRDYCTASVVQHVLGTMLLLTQRLREYDALVRSGAWSRGDQFCLLDFPIRELAGRKLASWVMARSARRARGPASSLGMDVWIASRRRRAARRPARPRRPAATGRRAQPALPADATRTA